MKSNLRKIPAVGRWMGWLAVAVTLIAPVGAETRPIELEDLFRLHRVSDPQVSPDGQTVVYVVTDPVKAENMTNSDLWSVRLDGTGAPHRLTDAPKHDRHPRWSPDGKWIAFESNRSGTYQIWLMPAGGGAAKALTGLSTGASQPMWAPNGKSLAFVSAVRPEFSTRPFVESDAANREAQEAQDKSKVKARLFTQLLYRHWDSWVDGLRQHLFVVPVAAGTATGLPRDVTPGDNDAIPTSDTFAAGDEFAFSPDGKELIFTAPPLPTRTQAWSTNHDLWAVDLETGERRQVTKNPAADGLPRWSPDGKTLAYRAQARPGFEADRWQLIVRDAWGREQSLTAKLDLSVGAFAWAPDGRALIFDADERGGQSIWRVTLDPSTGAGPVAGEPARVIAGGVNADEQFTPDGRAVVFTRARMNAPPEVMVQPLAGGEPRALTTTNATLLASLALSAPESVTVSGAGGTPVQMWILKPPHFDAAKKYPLVFWVHGGPQSAFADGWSTRWNPEVWAAQGYVIALPNPRGSVGFGQKFTDEISHDWGGKPYEDVMACLAFMEAQPYVDATRMAAAGASYGGYMMNWLNGHTDKFRCIVNHDGVYNFYSMYGGTEEVWFDEWEHGQPWDNPDFDKFSPHKFAANFKTPTLIIHNELDFRVPVSEGQQLFTTLQRRGIASKFLSFPDEGHWVLKPANSERWHQTIFAWLAKYLKR